ncbi:Ribosomal RNA large subunit methyltransferase K/L [Pseudoalteromonas holothuriae]|uniref:Ribosomal RNA large subunit methyltransferase K/L n=1 Tax=Pseudoalteromonas holothuriae TaxID=2963714 RepID=A0A9W4R277_9GAMM|nr:MULTISPECIES: class I SAM-dependent methyltransferase [unclassified Pseudoalteromonas]CAH9063674.1 Ribosomal RNA large subunit methyltransferase K/L [Pseudoalteromonas sp. CIP111854]CAH9064723.1 Ribosomal RNA large subunit methyltransferase K/L [Pseudoalteromonas sp. CIP111951]
MKPTALPLLDKHLRHIDVLPTEVRRLFHGRGQCFPGLEHISVDWLSGQVLISLFKEPEVGFIDALNVLVAGWLQLPLWQSEVKSVLLHHRSRDNCELQVLWGALSNEQVVQENELTYLLDLGNKQNNGLFLDMRCGRSWVKSHASGKSVLNLFAYTCGFSVAAIAGGAKQVVNLDMAKAALSKGRENHRANNHDLTKVKFLGHELFKSWGKVRKFGPYDLVIIDPPSFQKGSFALTKDYKKILRRLPELLTEQGQVLACVNDPSLNAQFLIDEMAEQAPNMVFVERLDNPPEFADINPEASLKSLLFTQRA